MAKGIEGKLAALARIKGAETPVAEDLAAFVEDRSNHVVAKAAKIAGERRVAGVVPQLNRAFDRFMPDGARTDKRCLAKIAIVQALRLLEGCEAEPMRQGARYVQMEPVFGGSEDSAGPLRVECAAALAELGDPGALVTIADLLGDPLPDARIGAARLLAQVQPPGAEALLRLRVRAGEKDAAAFQEFLAALLAVNPADSLAFVSRFLADPDPDRYEGAALALAESRSDGAFAALTTASGKSYDPERTHYLLSAIALLRRNDAIDFLVAAIANQPEGSAVDAIEALAIYGRDEAIVRRVRNAVTGRESPKLRKALAKSFGGTQAESG